MTTVAQINESLSNNVTYTKMNSIGTIFGECFDIEFSKLENEEAKSIMRYSLFLFMNTKLHTLFTDLGIKDTVRTVFENADIRDFILCLTDRFGIMSGIGENNIEKDLATGLGVDIITPGNKEEFSLMPKKILSNVELDNNVIYKALVNNKWLVTVILINLFLYKAKSFYGEGNAT